MIPTMVSSAQARLLVWLGYKESRWLYAWLAVAGLLVAFVAHRLPLMIREAAKTQLPPGESFKFDSGATGLEHSHEVLAIHVGSVFTWVICGTIQFVPRIRREYPLYHRISGRIYFLASVVVLTTGLFLAPTSFGGDFSSRSATWTIGITFAVSGAMGLTRAVQRRIQEHKRWMFRMYAAGGSVALSRPIVGLVGSRLLPRLRLWGTMSCNQIRHELRGEPISVLQEHFPACLDVPASSGLHVAVQTGTETIVNIILGLRMSFSVGLWLGLLVNLLIAEMLIHLEPDKNSVIHLEPDQNSVATEDEQGA